MSALASVSALVQNAEVASVLQAWRSGGEMLLPMTQLLLGYLPWVMGAGVVLSMLLLACAAGLRCGPAAAPGMGAAVLHRAAARRHHSQPGRFVAAA